MSIFDLFGPEDRRKAERATAILERVQANQADAYRKGFKDGVLETLEQLVGRSTIVGRAGTYDGPVPDELRAWAEQVRARGEGLP